MEEKIEYKSSKHNLVYKYYLRVIGVLGGYGFVAISNYYQRRPYNAGIQRHIFWAIVGGLLFHYGEKYGEKRLSERDAMVRHYIELHPEDFVEHKRKYKEVFDEWYPMR